MGVGEVNNKPVLTSRYREERGLMIAAGAFVLGVTLVVVKVVRMVVSE